MSLRATQDYRARIDLNSYSSVDSAGLGSTCTHIFASYLLSEHSYESEPIFKK